MKDMREKLVAFFAPGLLKEVPAADLDAAKEMIINPQQGQKRSAVPHLSIPAAFALRAHLECSGPEVAGMGSVRVAREGTRFVVLCSVSSICAFMAGPVNRIDEGTLTMDSVQKFITCVTSHSVEAFTNVGFTLWSATLGPHEALIVPVGFMIMETVHNMEVFGHKLNLVLGCPSAEMSLQRLNHDAKVNNNTVGQEDMAYMAGCSAAAWRKLIRRS